MTITQKEVDRIMSLDKKQVDDYFRLLNVRDGQLREVGVLMYNKGMKVKFDGGQTRGVVYGVVEKVNRKSVCVQEVDKNGVPLPLTRKWRVAPSLLKMVL